MMDYNLLAALSSVIREGSFEKAALSLNVSASAISQRIKLLESRTGAILIKRDKPCTATKLGYSLFEHAEKVSQLEYDFFQSNDFDTGFGEKAKTIIRIGVNGDSLNTWFKDVLIEFKKMRNVMFDIIRDDREYIVEALKKGDTIASVTPSNRSIHGFRKITLGCLDYCAVCSPEFYQEFFSEEVGLETLLNAPCITFDEKDSLVELWIERFFKVVPALNSHRVPSFIGYLEVCEAGFGWGVLPKRVVSKQIDSGALVELLPGEIYQSLLVWQYGVNSSALLQKVTTKVTEIAHKELSVEVQT